MCERRKEMAISLSAIKKINIKFIFCSREYVCPENSCVAVNFECYGTWPFRLSDIVVRGTWRLASSLRLVRI